MIIRLTLAALLCVPLGLNARQQTKPEAIFILRAARVFDGDAMHDGWSIRVEAIGSTPQVQRRQSTPPAAR